PTSPSSRRAWSRRPTATPNRRDHGPPPRPIDDDRVPRRARVSPPQLPPVLRRPGDLARRDLDATGRPGLARPPTDPRPLVARARVAGAVWTRDRPWPVRGRDRRPAAQTPDPDGNRDGRNDPSVH